MKWFIDKLYSAKIDEHKDIFERIVAWSIKKIEMARQMPLTSKVIFRAFADTSKGLEKEIRERYNKIYHECLGVFTNDIDTGLFREDVNVDKATDLLFMFIEAFANKYINRYKGSVEKVLNDADDVANEFNEYMSILKYGMYKRK